MTQLLLDRLTTQLNNDKRMQATMEDLEDACDRAVNDAYYIKDMVRQMVMPEERQTLFQAATEGQVASCRAAKNLARLHFLARDGDVYRFRVPIIRDYIAMYLAD